MKRRIAVFFLVSAAILSIMPAINILSAPDRKAIRWTDRGFLFNVDGVYHCIDNACPHRGGPLGEGDLEGRVVSCPWHAWRWDVTSGANTNNPAVRVAAYPVTVAEGGVFVELP